MITFRPRLERILSRLRYWALRIRGNLDEPLREVGILLEDRIKDNLSKGPKDHPPSSAGGNLATLRFPRNPTDHLRIRTGRLVGSVGYEVRTRGRGAEVRVGTRRVRYARIHEEGGQAGRSGTVRIRPRPYVRPALDASRGDITEILGSFVRPRIVF